MYPRRDCAGDSDDGVSLDFLGPSLPFIASSRNDINENSIAFLLRYGSFCMLFTGDAGASAERRFLAEGADLRCEVLKVGHHGSAYGSSATFIEAVRPRYALVSVGRRICSVIRRPKTIAALRTLGRAIYRTDENGAVTVASDGSSISVSPQFWVQTARGGP